MPAETYKAILDMQPQALFDGMMTRHPEAIEGFRRLAQLFGGAFLLLGHSQRAADAARRGMEGMGEVIKTVILGVLIFGGGSVLGMFAEAMSSAPKEIGAEVSTSALVTKLWEKTVETPNPFDVFNRPEGKDADADALTLEGALKGSTAEDPPAAEDKEDDSWLPSLGDFFNKMQEFIARALVGVVRIIMGVIGIIMMLLAIVVSMFIIWVMEALRYFTLVIGAAMLPLFIGFLSTENMKGAGWNYVLALIGIAVWPLGWAMGHAITIELFDLWLRLGSGEAGYSAISSGTITIGTFASMTVVQGLAFVMGGLGLMLWVLLVALVAPFLIAKTLTTGAEFGGAMLGKAVQTTAGVAGKVAQAGAMMAMPMAAPAIAGAGAAASGAGAAGAGAASAMRTASMGGGGGAMLSLASSSSSSSKKPDQPSLADYAGPN